MDVTDLSKFALDDGNGRRRIDHIAVAVWDADVAEKYYTEQLGLQRVHDEFTEEPGVRLTYLDAGNAFIQLVQPFRPGPVEDFLRAQGEGLHHICFAVDDINRATSLLPGQSEAGIFMGGRGRLACFLLGNPKGVRIELTETRPRGVGSTRRP